MVAADRRTHSPNRLVLSEGWRPPGAHSAFIKWTGWTLAMTMSWWQHHEHCRGYYYYYCNTATKSSDRAAHIFKAATRSLFREFLPSLWSLYFSSPFSFPYPILSRLEVAPQIQLRDSGSTVSSQAGKNNIGSHWLKFPGLIKYIKMRLRPSTDEFLRNQSQGTKSLGCKCRPRPISANRNLKIKSKCGCVWMYTPMHVTVCIR